ncbi:MAG: GTPase HflX, partial [Clostridia bacterium]|nr:GTPase HflX [Clostridia bacterium]
MNLTDALSQEPLKVVLVGVHKSLLDPLEDTTEESMRELWELSETAGLLPVATMVQNRPYTDKGTYIGEGKLEELKNACDTLDADLVIFDDGLTGSQLKNIENALQGPGVLDRNTLILEIFAQRAATHEGKLQAELAKLQYRLPRLAGLREGLSRLGGGGAGGGGARRGAGESQLELDRRYIRSRIGAITHELSEVKRHRELIRARREKDGVVTVALVGYTNAGKSTLLNALTGAEVSVRNRLFETLDPTARALLLPDGSEILLVDTVGFIRRLPHQFINAFKATLEEAITADVLLHVIDASSPTLTEQAETVTRLLTELGCGGTPTIAVFNKSDLLTEESEPRPSLPVSKNVYI